MRERMILALPCRGYKDIMKLVIIPISGIDLATKQVLEAEEEDEGSAHDSGTLEL